MFEYKINIDKKIIAILGPHLYGDTASIIAELISNSFDADANNCWVTIKTGVSPEIIIEDDGDGMTPSEVNTHFLDIGYNRRDERPVTKKGRKVFGRKGIGKLAAFSLAREIELYSLKDGKKAGCILDYEKITQHGDEPKTIPDEEIIFEKSKLSKIGSGTRIVLKQIQKNVNTTYYYLVNRIMRNFNFDFDKFKIHLIKNNDSPKTINYVDLDFFNKMDILITIGNEFKEKKDSVLKNSIPLKYKRVYSYEDDFKKGEKQSDKILKIPRSIEVFDKKGKMKKVDFIYKGWIGTIIDKEGLRGLVYKEGASNEENESISINDNRITIFSRRRIGEYDVLPKVQSDTIYDTYIIGEIQVDIFEDDNLVDMAISNRRGYEETDERYRALLEDLKSLVKFIVQKKAEVQKIKNEDKNKEEADKLKKAFAEKPRTMGILRGKLDKSECEIVADENFQFMRAAQLSQSTRKILISHDFENKEYGFFIMKIFKLLGIDVDKYFIFTSYPPTGVPHGANIYDYLKDRFREDIYVIFLFSKHFYDSNICIAETGAAWATNRSHSNIIIDIDYNDIDKPIDNAKNGFRISKLENLDKNEVGKFIKTVLHETGFNIPGDEKIFEAIGNAVIEFQGKLNSDSFYPKRKYQGHPVCEKSGCSNTMDLKKDGPNLYYKCKTPACKKKQHAKIY